MVDPSFTSINDRYVYIHKRSRQVSGWVRNDRFPENRKKIVAGASPLVGDSYVFIDW